MPITIPLGTSSELLAHCASSEARLLWPSAEPILREHAATFARFFEVEDLLALVEGGRMQLWVVFDEGKKPYFVCLTEVLTFPKTRAVVVAYACGKDPVNAVKHLVSIEDWAASQGVDVAIVPGRFGWRRLLAGQGYADEAGQLVKDISRRTIN